MTFLADLWPLGLAAVLWPLALLALGAGSGRLRAGARRPPPGI